MPISFFVTGGHSECCSRSFLLIGSVGVGVFSRGHELSFLRFGFSVDRVWDLWVFWSWTSL